MKKQIKPEWCLKKCEGEEDRCCRCGTYFKIMFQQGDGKILHSLCKNCYEKIKPLIDQMSPPQPEEYEKK